MAFALALKWQATNALASANGINLLGKVIRPCMIRKENGNAMILEQQALWNYPKQTYGVLGSPAKIYPLPVNKKGFKKVSEADCFMKLCGCLPVLGKKIDPDGFSLKMLKIYLALETDLISQGCSLKWGGYGYDCEWQLINSKDYGVPQNRERVFIVGHLGNGSGRKVFPICPADGANTCELRQINNPKHSTNRVYEACDGLAKTIKGTCGGGGGKDRALSCR